ncbi:MAG: carboxypeptidase regulatory-like domain-containing protein [Pyrinomonadaceae bacterium]
MHLRICNDARLAFRFSLAALFILLGTATVQAQDTVTGAFEGIVSDNQTGAALRGATVEIINQQTGLTFTLQTDFRGSFFRGLLLPGIYIVRVSMPRYLTKEVLQRLRITYTGEVVPIPVALDRAPVGVTPSASPTPAAVLSVEDTDIRATIGTVDGRRSGSFTEEEVVTLPVSGTTITRTFDELALLLPGVAPPPQTLGTVAGPGVGAGVGSAGQFAVNGLRSRGNNFTVDGSDNNDEDIGVRRQGFVALVPQPLESIQEYQFITVSAPAQFGRNIGAQVNAVSKSGGSETHGTVYGFFNSSQLNSRNFFDTANGNASLPLRTAGKQAVLLDGQPLMVRNESGGEDSFTLGQGGLAFGGPLAPGRMFYFVSAEGQLLNAAKEESFAVPTVEQRGVFGTGATGLFRDPFTGVPTSATPTSTNGSAIFSLFPFPNNSEGVYGPNTFTQVLPASGQGKVLSGKVDGNFKVGERQQSVTARYNFTDDWRNIPATGGALFSTLRPRVRTQNFSFFVNSEVSAPNSPSPVFNQVRLSYGRTRLKFEEVRERTFQIFSNTVRDTPFLLNAPRLLNLTLPDSSGVSNSGPVLYGTLPMNTVEGEVGPLGQVIVAGFSPIGVDVYNFPQRRVNNTYQFADQLTFRLGGHGLTFGTDNRRTELNSDLPRNSRPLVTFNGAPRLIFESGALRLPTATDLNPVIRPEDLAALGAASNFFLTLNTAGGDANINLRFYQLNFFAQDDWRVRRNLSLSFGLRYEYNTPVREVNQLVERTFNDPALNLAPGLRQFIDGRAQVYDPDRNNFAPRVGVAYSRNLLGNQRVTVFRAGYGLFYDQVLGAVVSQSRNVYPTFVTLNFGGLNSSLGESFITIFNPAFTAVGVNNSFVPISSPGTINRLNPELPLNDLLDVANRFFPSALGATLPARRLEMPMAHHYNFTFEQQLSPSLVVSAAYVGTQGRHLLRFTTPNLGSSSTVAPSSFTPFSDARVPLFMGRTSSPARPVRGLGAVNRFETTASSRYDALQLQVRGRLSGSLLYQVAYTFSKAADDVSDVFDLAGAAALPQNSLTFAGERGPANFDVRHRFTHNFMYSFPSFRDRHAASRFFLGGLEVAGTGQLRTGQPFTVNSVIDVNLDGNLTDRLDTTEGLTVTGDRHQPLLLATDNPLSLLAPFSQDGSVGRNTFRAGNVLEFDFSIIKSFAVSGTHRLVLRTDIFNVFNRANFGVPVRFLEAPKFGQATSTVTPGRRVQFALKYLF